MFDALDITNTYHLKHFNFCLIQKCESFNNYMPFTIQQVRFCIVKFAAMFCQKAKKVAFMIQ